jgi:hypothetical protein
MRAWLVKALLFVAACGGSAVPPEGAEVSRSASASSSAAPVAVDDGPPCVPETRAPRWADPVRDRALVDLADGLSAKATGALESVLARRPQDVAAFALREAAVADDDVARRDMAKNIEKEPPIAIASIGLGKPASGPDPKVLLRKVGEENRPGDYYGWLGRVGLPDPAGFDDPGTRDAQTFPPTLFDQPQTSVWSQPDQFVIRYGQGLLLVGATSVGARTVTLNQMLVDAFGPIVSPASQDGDIDIPRPMVIPEVRYAQVIGGTLVAELAHDGDGSTPPTGFLVGIDLATNEPRWSTSGTVATALSFHVIGDLVVTAYGDGKTARLVVTDAATGRVRETAPLAKRPDFITGRGNTVYAWSVEHADTFEVETTSVPAPLAFGKTTAVARKQPGRCPSSGDAT